MFQARIDLWPWLAADRILRLQHGAGRRNILILGAASAGTGLASQIALEIYHISVNVRDSRATDDAQLHATLLTVFVFDGIEHVIDGPHALLQRSPISAFVIGQTI